jgi:hypothetical protein
MIRDGGDHRLSADLLLGDQAGAFPPVRYGEYLMERIDTNYAYWPIAPRPTPDPGFGLDR